MLNLVGTSYDYGSVIFAVLQECEHRRKSLLDAEAGTQLLEIARQKVSELEKGYVEAGGAAEHWTQLEIEVLENVMPRYIPAAIEQTRLERTNFDLWRGADLVSRGSMALAMLVLGGLIIWMPFIPIIENAFAFFLAVTGWFYPELKRLLSEYRHSKLLNGIVIEGTKYQRLRDQEYLRSPHLAEALEAMRLPELESEDRKETKSSE